MLLLQQPQTTVSGPASTARTFPPLLNPPLSDPPFVLSHDLNNGHDAVSDSASPGRQQVALVRLLRNQPSNLHSQQMQPVYINAVQIVGRCGEAIAIEHSSGQVQCQKPRACWQLAFMRSFSTVAFMPAKRSRFDCIVAACPDDDDLRHGVVGAFCANCLTTLSRVDGEG